MSSTVTKQKVKHCEFKGTVHKVARTCSLNFADARSMNGLLHMLYDAASGAGSGEIQDSRLTSTARERARRQISMVRIVA